MTVKILLECGGCDAKAPGTDWLKGRFISLSGQDHGIGGMDYEHLLNSLFAACPEGWTMFDPYTYCTYCPACMEKINCAHGGFLHGEICHTCGELVER